MERKKEILKDTVDKLVKDVHYNPRTKRLEFGYDRPRGEPWMRLYQTISGYSNPDGSYSITVDNNIQDWELEQYYNTE